MKKIHLRRLTAVLAALTLVCCLAGCDTDAGKNPPEKDPSSQTSGNSDVSGIVSDKLNSALNNQNDPSSEVSQSEPEESQGGGNETAGMTDPSYYAFVEQLQEYQMAAGVAFLGYVEGPMGDGYLGALSSWGYLEDYPFTGEIPYENYVETDGDEMYCVVPADPNASVAVNEWIVTGDTVDSGEAGEVLYRSESGEPIMVTCNDTFNCSNAQVVITDENGNTTSFLLFLSPKTDMLFLGEAAGDIYDFSIYSDQKMGTTYFEQLMADSDVLLGTWSAEDAYDINGDNMMCSLTFYRDENGASRMEYFYGLPMSDIYERFEGSYYSPDQPEYGDMVMFDMELTGGLALEEGVEPYFFGGMYLILYYPELDVIEVIHMEGTPLLAGMEGSIITFGRSMG